MAQANPTNLPAGLSAEEARRRGRQYGPNRLPRPRRAPVWRQVGAQFTQFFAVMLWVAGGLAIVAGMPQLGVAIFVVIVLNGLFAFLQEHRANRAAERLGELLPLRATVIRDGKRQEVEAAELVPGDVVAVTAGDRISADLRWLAVETLAVDVSAMTGESVPVTPQAGEAAEAGTFAVEGEGWGEVTAIGAATRLARLARLTAEEHRPRSPLALELDRLVRVIALVAVSVGAGFWGLSLLVGIPWSDAFLFAVGVTVAMVPEGLLPTVTLSLAMGAQRMAARHALVRRLESVETLGSTTFICTDKTGTLTRNEMAVVEAWTPAGTARIAGRGYEPTGTLTAEAAVLPRLRELASAAARFVNGRAVEREGQWVAQGHPLEVALTVVARRLQLDLAAEEAAAPARRVFPFDPRRRRMSVVAGNQVLVRGAPEAVLERCHGGGAAEDGAAAQVAAMAAQGWRVLAVAVRELAAGEEPDSAEAAERELRLLGLVGIADAPRAEVAGSIAACRRAGIRVAMVTGDHPATARAIAREVGLWTSDELVFEGKDLPRDDAVLGALLDRDGAIVSRVSPEDKLRIARALRQRGHVVAMTGDGVNDAPALQEADIGVAMGRSGTDVAREAADLVLLDDNFATIVAAIEQGRTTFANARRFLTYHLTDNVAELAPFVVWALTGGRFPLALGVLQVLFLDIGTDIAPAVALGAEPSSPRALAHPPWRGHLVDGGLLWRAFGVLGLTESVVEMAAFLAAMAAAGWRPGGAFPTGGALRAASGAAFTAVIAGQMANAFACRSASQWPGKLGWGTNRYLVVAVAVEAAMLALFLYVPPVARLLGQTAPNAAGYLVALLAAPAVLLMDGLQKRLRRAEAPLLY